MDGTLVFFLISLILIATLGFLAQRIGLCMVRGVEQAVNGKPGFLTAILCSGAFAWMIALAIQYTPFQVASNHSTSHFTAYQISIYSLIGGLLFGLGAAFNSGCGVSTISRLVRGQSVMVATVIGWFIGWLLFSGYMQNHQPVEINGLAEYNRVVLFVLSMIILIIVSRLPTEHKAVWRDLLLIGLMASVIFLYEPKWTPSGLLKDMGLSIWDHDESYWPTIDRFLLMVSLMFGMLVAAIYGHTFKLTFYAPRQYVLHLSAGILMGIGAVIAGGGNDSLLLIALPSLSPAGIVSVIFIIVGIYLGRRLVTLLRT